MSCLDSTCFATGENLNYVLVLLNSKLGKLLLQNAPQTGTGDLLISVQALEPLKIAECKNIALFNKLFKNISSDMTAEQKLMEIIYKNYDFTPIEIEFISNF